MTSATVIIAAAGRGSRLSSSVPKALYLVDPIGTTMLEHQIKKFVSLGFTTYPVMSPSVFSTLGKEHKLTKNSFIQEVPTGMGDALFSAREAIRGSERVLFTWVDQLGLSTETIAKTERELGSPERCYVVPCLSKEQPYTGLDWNRNGVTSAFESREGDFVPKGSVSDVGLFGFTDGSALVNAWDDYRATQNHGAITGEVNFLKFLPWLTEKGWLGKRVNADASDGFSVNTLEELEAWRRNEDA